MCHHFKDAANRVAGSVGFVDNGFHFLFGSGIDAAEQDFVATAQGDIVYTVTFHNADQEPKNDSLVAGQSVRVRDGTNFDVRHAVRS